jgi:hypothetical protein
MQLFPKGEWIMTYIETKIKESGHYVCDMHKKKRGNSNPIEVDWSTGFHFGGRTSNFCTLTAMVEFAKKNEDNKAMIENCGGLLINDCYLARYVMRLIIHNNSKMPKEPKKWENEALSCKRR